MTGDAASVVWRGEIGGPSLNLIQCMWKLYCVERRYARLKGCHGRLKGESDTEHASH